MQSIAQNSDEWQKVLGHPQPETIMPEPWLSEQDPSLLDENARLLRKMIVFKALRPDRLGSIVMQLVANVLGAQVSEPQQIDLLKFTCEAYSAKSPLMLISAPGFDASHKVVALAKQYNKRYSSIAIGSQESFD